MTKVESGVSLGHTALRSNNLEGEPFVTLNYVNPDHKLALPFPDGDWYLRNTAVPAISSGETVICNNLIEGLYEYYSRHGLIPQDSHIIEVEPDLNGEVTYGYPATDPLESLSGRVKIENSDNPMYLVPTFSNDGVSRQQRALNIETINRRDSAITNNKEELRESAVRFGFQMLPGATMRSLEDVETLVQQFSSTEYGVWLKFPTGSGGDLVKRIPFVTTDEVLSGISEIRSSIERALFKGSFGRKIEELWPRDSFSPLGFGIVIESDARNLGEVVINGSTQFITSRSGMPEIIGYFDQITTDEGEYLGNRPFRPKNGSKLLVDDQVQKVANYSTESNEYFGVQGVDWFLIRDDQGKESVYVVELNSRPTANTPPYIVATKLGAENWINTNVYTDKPIQTISDYVEVIGEDLAYGNIEQGLVIPQAFRTLVTRKNIIPSPNFKVLIMGKSEERCNEIVKEMEKRKVRFRP